MAFSINTNIASLQSQEYLRMSSDFQSKTINRVTSGLRILSSGDDAAGLAIANGIRSDRAVLMQGVRNANDGLSTLQTIDGGLNNISQLLDRARTLAAQSATGTFTGSRSVLNSEFSSVLEEIDRQSQAIGLNTNGTFAKSLSVFIGGGRSSGGVSEISNGSIGVDLRTSTVDTLSLGLKGVQAGKTGYDLGTGTTSVENITADSDNQASLATANHTVFRFFGPGFGDDSGINVAVNINNVASTDALAAAVNTAIQAAGEDPTSAAAAFKAAGITAKVVTDSDGKQQLAFTSSKASFQVYGGDRMANALLGDYSATDKGSVLATNATAAAGAGSAGSFAGTETLQFRFEGGGLTSSYDLTFSPANETATLAALDLQTAIANDATLRAAGITLTGVDPTAGLEFTSANGESIRVSLTGDLADRFGMGAFFEGAGGEFEYNSIVAVEAGSGPVNTDSTRFSFSFNGGTAIDINLAWTAANVASDLTKQAAINAALDGNATARAAGLRATVSSGDVTFTANAGTNFRLQASGNDADAGYGGLAAGAVGYTAVQASATFKSYIGAGSYQLGSAGTAAPLSFSAINFASDTQAITVQANDATGASHELAVSLTNANARSIDEAIATINTALQQSNDDTLKRVTAVKVNDAGTEKINFVSTVSDFRVAIGKNASGTGIDQTSSLVESTQVGSGANATIDTQSGAEAAVSALSASVSVLGSAQAVVGRGQNQFNYAVSLASTQLTNLAASESRIRDADLAAEAANLTKAQVLQQAGIAALAQANSSTQAVLSLLRG